MQAIQSEFGEFQWVISPGVVLCLKSSDLEVITLILKH